MIVPEKVKKIKKKEPKIKPKYSTWQNIQYYFKVLNDYKCKINYIVWIDIPITLLFTLVSTYTTKLILDRLEFNSGFQEVAFIIIGIFVTQLILGMMRNSINAEWSFYDMDICGCLMVMNERKKLSLDYEYLENPKIQTLMSKASDTVINNHTAVVNFPKTLFNFIGNILYFLIFGGVLSTLNPIIIILVIASTFTGYIPQKLYRNYEHRTKDKRSDASRKVGYFTSLSRNFEIAKDIRLFSMRSWLDESAKEASKKYTKLLLDLENRDVAVSMVGFLVTFLRDGAAYAYLIYRAVKGDITSGDFVLYFTAISSLGGWFQGILSGWSEIHRTSLQICDLREFMELPNLFNHDQGTPLPCKDDEIEVVFEDVSFTYPSADSPTLEHINFTIHPGEKLAVVGTNGAGKTTLVKLLCGLYTPTSGRIFVNGHEIKEYNCEDYYSMVSAIFQFSSILPISIAENIAVCERENIDEKRLKDAVELAGFKKKIDSLKDGIYTPINKSINKNGIELSGGEKQKLLLARAIYKDARLLVLDEPTSALDPIAESQMYESYHTFAKHRTSIFVSHRLASTHFCDRIILIGEKTILESGTHKELMKLGGRYAELFDIQSHYYKEEGTK